MSSGDQDLIDGLYNLEEETECQVFPFFMTEAAWNLWKKMEPVVKADGIISHFIREDGALISVDTVLIHEDGTAELFFRRVEGEDQEKEGE